MTEQMSHPEPHDPDTLRLKRVTIKGLPSTDAFSDKRTEVTFDLPVAGETTGEFNKIIEQGYNGPDAKVSADPADRFPKETETDADTLILTRVQAKQQGSYVGRRENNDDYVGRHRAGGHSGKENYTLSATVSEYIRGAKSATARVLGAFAAAKAVIIPKDAGYIGRHSTEGLYLAEQAERSAHQDDDVEVEPKLETPDTNWLRDIQLSAASRLATRSQRRHEKWAEMDRGDRKDTRRARVLGGAALLMAAAGVAVVARHYGMETSTGGSGSTAAVDILGGQDTGDSLPLITDADLSPKGGASGDYLPTVTEADLEVIPKEALRVDKGEGLHQTMKELGIPKSKWDEVMKEVGPKLVKMKEAYPDESIGGHGLIGDGKLSRKAIRLFQNAKALK